MKSGNTFNVGVLGSSPKRITQTKSKTMKTADNQSLLAVFLFIHTANWGRIRHPKGGEIGGLDFHLKKSPPICIIFHWFSVFCIMQTLFKTCNFTPTKKQRVWQCKETILRYCFSEKFFYNLLNSLKWAIYKCSTSIEVMIWQ